LATLSILSNDPDRPLVEIQLSGAGIETDTSSAQAVYWSMDEETASSGYLEDLTGNGHNGYFGDLVFVPGYLGDALRFQMAYLESLGTGDADDLDLGESFTLAAWINPATFGTDNRGPILDKLYQSSSSYRPGYRLELDNREGLKLLVLHGLNDGTPIESDAGAVGLNRWQHVAVVFENSQVTFYVDGQPVGVRFAAWSQPLPSSQGLRVGLSRTDADWWYFDGDIDEFRIYNRALDLFEIQTLAR